MRDHRINCARRWADTGSKASESSTRIQAWVRARPWLLRLVGWETRHRLLLPYRRIGAAIRRSAIRCWKWNLRQTILPAANVVFRLLRIEIVVIYNLEDSVGHQAVELEHYFKEMHLKGIRRPFILANMTTIRNPFLHELFERRYPYFHHISASLELRFRRFYQAYKPPFVKLTYGDEGKYEILSRYQGPPLIALSKADEQRGEVMLRQMGLSEGDWFVCVHNREVSSIPYAPYHSHRDCQIANCSLAIKRITERGGWVVRMGDPSMNKMDNLEKTIDYPHSQWRSAFADVYLVAKCRFFVGNTSGITNYARLFNVPCCLTNIIPLLHIPINCGKVFIPKRIFSTQDGRYLTFREVVSSDLAMCTDAKIYDGRGLIVEENSPEEICELINEMFEILDDAIEYTDEDQQLQQRFRFMLNEYGYTFRSPARVGRAFISRHRELFI